MNIERQAFFLGGVPENNFIFPFEEASCACAANYYFHFPPVSNDDSRFYRLRAYVC